MHITPEKLGWVYIMLTLRAAKSAVSIISDVNPDMFYLVCDHKTKNEIENLWSLYLKSRYKNLHP